MPLGLGMTVDYIFFSAESCENENRSGKTIESGVSRSHPRMPGNSRWQVGFWWLGLGSRSRCHTSFVLILYAGYLPYVLLFSWGARARAGKSFLVPPWR